MFNDDYAPQSGLGRHGGQDMARQSFKQPASFRPGGAESFEDDFGFNGEQHSKNLTLYDDGMADGGNSYIEPDALHVPASYEQEQLVPDENAMVDEADRNAAGSLGAMRIEDAPADHETIERMSK